MPASSRAAAPLARFALTAVAAAGLVLSTAVAPAAAADPVLGASVDGAITLPAADGFQDVATLSVTSDTDIDAKVEVLDGANTVVETLANLELTDGDGNGTFTGTAPLQDLGLAAGEYTVRVTETVGGTVTASAPLIVGSGTIVRTTLVTSPTFFPFKDGYLDTVKANVTAFDETDTALPYSGYVTVSKGTAKTAQKPIASASGATASALVSITSLPVGTASVNAHITGPDGALTVAKKSTTLAYTKVTGLAVTKDISTVYPAIDSFQDTASIKVIPTSSTGTTIPVTGKVAISLNGKIVKTWTLTSSATKSFTWNGLHGGKIVPGKYTVTVSAKGPQGATATASMFINVSAKKLVTKTASRTVNAKPVFKEYVALDEAQLGECWYTPAEVIGCDGYEADESGLSLYASGSFTVPVDIRNAYSASVRVTANVDLLVGDAGWIYYYGEGDDEVFSGLELGNNTRDWLKVQKDYSKVSLDFALTEYSSVDIDYYKIEYRYKVLQ